MRQQTITKCIIGALAIFGMKLACASMVVSMNMVDPNGQGKNIGTITLDENKYGVLITPNLHDLPPGPHGFHVHEKPDCGNNAVAAGGHFDPTKSGKHNGPFVDTGHMGDMPVLVVDKDGNATIPTLAPRMKLSDFEGHSFMIHAGGDNYSDTPTLGGGGARIACGVISASSK